MTHSASASFSHSKTANSTSAKKGKTVFRGGEKKFAEYGHH
jgi:hypothetical protein